MGVEHQDVTIGQAAAALPLFAIGFDPFIGLDDDAFFRNDIIILR